MWNDKSPICKSRYSNEADFHLIIEGEELRIKDAFETKNFQKKKKKKKKLSLHLREGKSK